MNTLLPMHAPLTGTLLLVVGAAGSGKGELLTHLRTSFPKLTFALSCVTRAKRPGEVDGVTYHFVSDEEFDKKIQAGEFLEWVEKDGGNKYGTLKSTIIEPLLEGKVVAREVDVPGVKSILHLLPRKNIYIIWIDAGSWETMAERIKKRAPISDEELEFRRKRYEEEIPFFSEHADAIVQNGNGMLEEAKQHISEIVQKLLSR